MTSGLQGHRAHAWYTDIHAGRMLMYKKLKTYVFKRKLFWRTFSGVSFYIREGVCP